MSAEPNTQDRKPALRALRFLAQERWAIQPETLLLMRDIAAREHAPDFEAVLAKRGAPLDRESRTVVRGHTAVVPVRGPIFRYANLFTEFSGGTTIDQTAREFRTAEETPGVRSIVLHMDTPGGMVNGTSEFAQMVRASSKPVVAYVGGMAASAGYWIASAARSIVMADTAQVGSIGVVSAFHVDDDDSLIEIVSSQSPKKRIDGRSEEGRAHIQAQTDEIADIFINAVAKNRDVGRETVLSDFGQGGLLIGASAVKAGMADRIGSLEALLADLN